MKAILLILCSLPFFLHAQAPTKAELEASLKKNPGDRGALYNLGLWHYLNDDFAKASESWARLKKLEPNDWMVRQKLLQSWWGEGKAKEVEKEIEAIRKERASGGNKELTEKKFFIRDQFTVGKIRVFVLEYFDFKGERPLLWKFILRSGEKKVDHFYSVGSYETTTEFMRANGEIGKNERAYHLDGYSKGGHVTYGIFKKRPGYGVIRKQVEKIMAGEKEGESSTKPGPESEKEE